MPKVAFGGAKCGNGILEEGEECDCGSTTSCPNRCCVPSTCRLAEHAECADGDCCDTETCKVNLGFFRNFCELFTFLAKHTVCNILLFIHIFLPLRIF